MERRKKEEEDYRLLMEMLEEEKRNNEKRREEAERASLYCDMCNKVFEDVTKLLYLDVCGSY
jgi:hypothetical protein